MKKKDKKIKTSIILTPSDESKSVCPRCKSYYAGKIPVLDFKDPEYSAGKREKPPTIMVKCHGAHPQDPWEGKD